LWPVGETVGLEIIVTSKIRHFQTSAPFRDQNPPMTRDVPRAENSKLKTQNSKLTTLLQESAARNL
jgi:hypothetical protein